MIDWVYVLFFIGILTMSVIYYRDWKGNKYKDSKDWFFASLVGLAVIVVFEIRDMFFDLDFIYSVSISIIGVTLMLGTMFFAWWKNR